MLKRLRSIGASLVSRRKPYQGLARARRKFTKQRARFYGDFADAMADGANPYELFRRRFSRAQSRKLAIAPLYELWRDRAATMSLRDTWDGSVPNEDMLVISAGERGDLPHALRFLAKVVDLRQINRRNIKAAVALPIFLLVVMMVFQMVVALKMMPIMTEIMPPEAFPPVGKALYDISQIVMDYWYVIYGLPVLVVVIFFLSLGRWTGALRLKADRFLLPYSIYRDVRSGEFLMSLAALTEANVSTYDALSLMMPHADGWTRWHLARVRLSLRSDHDITRAIDTGIFSDEIYDRVCEYAERSNFESGIRKIGLTTIEEVAFSINKRSAIVRNVLLVSVGMFIIFTLLGMISIGMAAGDAAQSGMM